MQITVNNEKIEIEEGANVSTLVQSTDSIPKSGIAIAINQEVIPTGLWDSQIIQSNDNILIIQATQGG